MCVRCGAGGALPKFSWNGTAWATGADLGDWTARPSPPPGPPPPPEEDVAALATDVPEQCWTSTGIGGCGLLAAQTCYTLPGLAWTLSVFFGIELPAEIQGIEPLCGGIEGLVKSVTTMCTAYSATADELNAMVLSLLENLRLVVDAIFHMVEGTQLEWLLFAYDECSNTDCGWATEEACSVDVNVSSGFFCCCDDKAIAMAND